MEEIVKELGGSIQAGAVSVIALAMAYGVYAGYFKQMIETFFTNLWLTFHSWSPNHINR